MRHRNRITLRDVAEAAGVSRSAVSRSFTEGASVSPETRHKVLTTAAALGYSPNVLASSLTTRRTRLIGLVADSFTNPVFLVVFDQFTRHLQQRGFRPLLVNLSGETAPADSVALLQQYSVDGVIVASSTLPPDFTTAFMAAGLPVVHSFGRISPKAATPIVGVDNVAAGRLAARVLLDHGYRRIGFVGGPKDATSTIDRLAGFAAEAGASNPPLPDSFARTYNYDAGREAMARLIASGELAQAYFCGDDQLAIGAMDALAEAGLRVPEDVGLIGMNDMDMARWHRIALTTIRQPFERIIGASVDLVLSLIVNPDAVPGSITLPCEVILRGTLRPAQSKPMLRR